jgi:subtilase family serine protease
MSRKAQISALGCVMALVLFGRIPAYAQSNTASHPLISQTIDETVLVILAGNTRPEVRFARDLGPVPDSLQLSHMYLQMKMTAEQEMDAAALMARLHDPSTADYHRWLSLAEIESRFGPAEEDIHTVSAWLESHGFTVNFVYRANGVIDFSGPASAIREAFHIEIHNIEVRGVTHIANIRDPQIPAALAPAVHGVTSMNDFHPHNNLAIQRKELRQLTAQNGKILALVPDDLATIYDFYPVYKAGFSGKGQTIMVIEDSDLYSTNDWHTFRQTFGLDTRYPFGSLTTIHPQPPSNPLNGGPCADPGVNGDDSEASVDSEWSSASAPNAAIIIATCANTNTNFGGFIAMQNVLSTVAPPPGMISISYGESESLNGASSNAYIDGLYLLAVLRGVSVFVAAGDAGGDASDEFAPAAVNGLNVSALAVTQYNVAVGGTDFSDTVFGQNATYWSATNGPFFNSAKSYIPEMPWDDSCANVPLSNFLGFAAPYGSDGWCNNVPADLQPLFLVVAAGSGGPSSCFAGTPAIPGVADGTCEGYPKPFYQYFAPGIPFDGVRDIPDITMFAANGLWGHYYIICYSDPTPNFGGAPCTAGEPQEWAGFGGTSFGAPIMAGVQALINEAVSTQFDGNPNYIYYLLDANQNAFVGLSSCNSSLGTSVDPRCVFHDVTFGDNDVNCLPLTNSVTGAVIGTFNCYIPSGTNGVLSLVNNQYEPAYTATPGYDFSSGMGSVDVFHLVKNWPGSSLEEAAEAWPVIR